MTFKILTQAFQNWLKDDPFTQSAAAAYYAIFSFPGLLIIVMAIAAFAFDQRDVEVEVVRQLSRMLGTDTAHSLHDVVEETQKENRDIWAFIIGLATLIFGATGLFSHLQLCINRIFDVDDNTKSGFFHFIKTRFVSFGMILVLGILLLFSLVLTALLSLIGDWITSNFSPFFSSLFFSLNILISSSLIIFLFTLIYKFIPDVFVQWRAAIWGGIIATLFFKLGEYGLTFYFEAAKPQSGFGAAGSLVLLMLWTFYSCMILFIGAEVTKIHNTKKT